MILPYLETHYNWKFVFYFFIFCIFVCLKFIFYMMIREIDCLGRFFAKICACCCRRDDGVIRTPPGPSSPLLEADDDEEPVRT